MLAEQVEPFEAIASYQQSLALRQELLAHDPANTVWQREFSISQERLGDMSLSQGDAAAGLAAYRESLAAREALVARDPANVEWQRSLSIAQIKIGNVLLLEMGDGAGALAAYRESLAICETLVARDSANAEWQRDLSVSHERIGDVFLVQRDSARALAAYGQSLALREALVAVGATETSQLDLAIAYGKLGSVAEGQTIEIRRGYLTRGRSVLSALKATGRLRPGHDLAGWFDQQLALFPHARKAASKARRPRKQT